MLSRRELKWSDWTRHKNKKSLLYPKQKREWESLPLTGVWPRKVLTPTTVTRIPLNTPARCRTQIWHRYRYCINFVSVHSDAMSMWTWWWYFIMFNPSYYMSHMSLDCATGWRKYKESISIFLLLLFTNLFLQLQPCKRHAWMVTCTCYFSLWFPYSILCLWPETTCCMYENVCIVTFYMYLFKAYKLIHCTWPVTPGLGPYDGR